MAYGEATIRAHLKTVMESVDDIGQVHDYERWLDDWGGLLTLMQTQVDGIDQLRGWFITLESWEQRQIAFMGGGADETRLVQYNYRLRGFMAVDDSEATEKTFAALAFSLADALEADTTLQGDVLERETPVVEGGLMDYRMFAGVLCHYFELRVHPQEVV
jgi:hypothetical protein